MCCSAVFVDVGSVAVTWFASMSGEPAHRRTLRLRQAAHCMLPSLEPSLPIDVRLGPRRRIGGPGSVCCGHDHIIWIRRIHGHAHEVAVLQSILGRTPRVRSIGASESEVITCFLSLARRHVHENARRSIARAGDVATGRLPSLGDRVNSSAKQYLEIAHELSHYSTQLPIGRSEPLHHQQVLYFELKYSHCR